MHFIILLALKVLLYMNPHSTNLILHTNHTNRGQMPNNEILLQQQP